MLVPVRRGVRLFALTTSLFLSSCSGGRGASLPPSTTAAPTNTPESTQKVVLGREWGPTQVGYGAARPREVFNGGDPTGHLWDIDWASWGSSRAIGHGMGFYTGDVQYIAAGRREPATVVAFDLGACEGKTMYRRIEWFFPEYGGRWDPNSYVNICTGEYSHLAP